MADGDIRPLPNGVSRTNVSRQTVRRMRPARDEIIICTGFNLRNSGVQLWGDLATGCLI